MLKNTGFDKKLETIKKDGVENLHILADFDRTLTYAFDNGKTRSSLISVLRDENILDEDYSKRAKELFKYYHSIEIDPNIALEEKKKQMQIWWEKHKKLLIEKKLTKKDIQKALDLGVIKLRKGVKEFLIWTNKNNIPFVIISANGLGSDSIKLYLKQQNLLLDNVYIVSNEFIWDKNNIAIDFKRPVIHSFNKDETILKSIPEIFEKIKNRKNIILFGDSLGDVKMADGFDYKTIIKIGFLNDKIENLLEEYKKNYDALILNDGDFEKFI